MIFVRKVVGVGWCRYSCLTLLAVMLLPFLAWSASPSTGSKKESLRVLNFAMGGDVRTLDPSVERGDARDSVMDNITDPLVLYGKTDSEPIPHLATAWNAIDKLTWRVKLRHGVKFQNGEPFNAAAAKLSIERLLDPAIRSDWSSMFRNVVKVDIEDNYTILIRTKVPVPLMPKMLRRVNVIPPKYLVEVGNEEFAKKPIGTGPYRVIERNPDEYILLEANKDYWGGKPAYDQLKVHIIPDASARVLALLAGKIDIAASIPPALIKTIEADPKHSVKMITGMRTAYLQMVVKSGGKVGPGNKALQDPRVRQAIAYAIDVDSIIKNVLYNTVSRVKTLYNPLFYSKPLPNVMVYDYNPDKARKLLADAGYAKGFPFSIAAAPGNFPGDKEVVEAIAGFLKNVGIGARLDTYERATWLEGYTQQKIATDSFFTYLIGVPPDATGIVSARFHKSFKSAYYYTDETNALVDKILTEIDVPTREKLLADLAALIQKEMPMVPLYSIALTYGISNQIDFEPNPEGSFNGQSVKPRVR